MAVLSWVKSNLLVARPVGPARLLRRFSPDLDVPIASAPDIPLRPGVTEIDGGWRFESRARRVFTLFTFDTCELPRGMLIYRAETRSRAATTAAYLELWLRAPGRGEYFARGTHDAVKGYRRWRRTEIPFFLPSDRYADSVTLNLTFAAPGAVEVRDVELLWRRVPRPFEPAQLPRTTVLVAWRSLRLLALTAFNTVIVAAQLVLLIASTALGLDISPNSLFTWWPQKKVPEVGKLAG